MLPLPVRLLRAAACAVVVALLSVPALPLAGNTPANAVDRELVARIRQKAFESSQVMALARVLCKDIGARVSGSPKMDMAARWAIHQFSTWGLSRVHGESWELPFQGWSVDTARAQLVAPERVELSVLPAAWSPATPGRIKAGAVAVQAGSTDELQPLKGKLAGKILFVERPPQERPEWTPPPRRLGPEKLRELAAKPKREPAPSDARSRFEKARKFREELVKFVAKEKVAVLVEESYHRDPEVVGMGMDGLYEKKTPMLAMASGHFRRVVTEIRAGKPVELEVEIASQFHDSKVGYNVIAEIPGSSKPDEVVILGAHLDSWPGAEGATDNAAGVAVLMEVARLFRALDLRPARTIRFVLWSGEEQGLVGSRMHVRGHYIRRVADAHNIWVTPEYFKVSAYFNLDHGSGAIRGIYAQENEEVIPIFRAWADGLPEFGEMVISPQATYGSDHAQFDRYGIPGFAFIQDPLDYTARTHHSQFDSYEMLEPEDLKEAAAVVTVFLHHSANREQLLPRKTAVTPRLWTR